VYPKARAFELAKATNEPVLFMAAEIPSEVTEPIKPAAQPVQSNAEPVATELTEAPVQAVTPAGQEVQLAQVVTPPPASETRETPAPATMQAENKLPATASPLPLVGLLGVMALGAAFTIGIAAKLFA
jgi:cobalamin biosynthesis Mg chelatase CobN